jgi:hypothetical protein
MMSRKSKLALAALALAVTIPVAAAVSQSQATPGRDGWSPELRGRLNDGRIAMIREALRLDENQQKLWAPVEAQLRASFDAREHRRAKREERQGDRERASLADRLDRRSQRLTERAERTKALAEAFRPFYEALSDDQKAVANIVMRRTLGRGFGGRHGHYRHAHRQ